MHGGGYNWKTIIITGNLYSTLLSIYRWIGNLLSYFLFRESRASIDPTAAGTQQQQHNDIYSTEEKNESRKELSRSYIGAIV